MVYYNALYNWVVFHPLYNPGPTKGPFFIAHMFSWKNRCHVKLCDSVATDSHGVKISPSQASGERGTSIYIYIIIYYI